jgi:hypothetical protein
MATTVRRIGDTFTSEKTIGVLYSENGLRSPRMITADTTKFTASPGGSVIIPPGHFWEELVGGLGRVLPMTKAVAQTLTSSPTLVVANASIFVVGEVLTLANADAVGTISAIDTETNTITLTGNTTTQVDIDDVVMVASTVYTGVKGMNISAIDLLKVTDDIALYTSASVYESRMPIWDATLAAAFPEITTV